MGTIQGVRTGGDLGVGPLAEEDRAGRVAADILPARIASQAPRRVPKDPSVVYSVYSFGNSIWNSGIRFLSDANEKRTAELAFENGQKAQADLSRGHGKKVIGRLKSVYPRDVGEYVRGLISTRNVDHLYGKTDVSTQPVLQWRDNAKEAAIYS